MDFRVISLPPFTALTSGVDPVGDFTERSALWKFNDYFSTITPSPRDGFMPRDFLFFNEAAGGMEWWWALAEGMPDGGFEKVSFEGGYYLTYFYRDGDGETHDRLYAEAKRYIDESEHLELDERPGHYSMGHIITPPELAEAQGFALMEVFIPIKRKG